jgi:hypothetical protein
LAVVLATSSVLISSSASGDNPTIDCTWAQIVQTGTGGHMANWGGAFDYGGATGVEITGRYNSLQTYQSSFPADNEWWPSTAGLTWEATALGLGGGSGATWYFFGRMTGIVDNQEFEINSGFASAQIP